VYRNAERELGADPDDLWLVAAHAWDLMGAKRCGWSTAWTGHHEEHLVATIPGPDVQGPTLGHVTSALAERLAALADRA
jgi:2-haloacid dehalogenase